MTLRWGIKPSRATLPVLRPASRRALRAASRGADPGRGSYSYTRQFASWVRHLREPRVAGKEGAVKAVQARGILPSAPSPRDIKGPLSSLQAAGKGSVRWLPYIPWFCLQGNHTCSVAFLSVLVSAEPKNIARGTMRICPQSSGLALVPTCFASSRATFRHSGEKIEKIEKQLSGGDC